MFLQSLLSFAVGAALVIAMPARAADSAVVQAAPAAAQAAPAQPSAAAARAARPFATVGETVITGADYQLALSAAMRKKYYHARPPEAEFAQFQREVGDNVVNRVLLLAEARRRGVLPDRAQIDATVAGYDAQYKGSASWLENREKMLANVVPQLELESMLERLEKIIRTVPEPTEAEARAFYESRKELFVEPEQVKLSVILLRVDPSSRQVVWNSAREEAKQLHAKLVAGANFGDLAKLHSGDKSAAQGGEMDYTHRGMLPEAVHGVVDKLAVGGLSEPVQLLEGVAIMRLDGRRVSQQRSFEQVRERAGDLWQRDEGEARWKKLIAELRQAATIIVDETHYAPLRGGSSEKPHAG